jgi:hypothetical protein
MIVDIVTKKKKEKKRRKDVSMVLEHELVQLPLVLDIRGVVTFVKKERAVTGKGHMFLIRWWLPRHVYVTADQAISSRSVHGVLCVCKI